MSDDIVKRFIELMVEADPVLSKAVVANIERQIRQEYAGEMVYIRTRAENLQTIIAERFTGNNAAKLARELQVSRSTIYRAARNRRKAQSKV